jgi:hypothetical protein
MSAPTRGEICSAFGKITSPECLDRLKFVRISRFIFQNFPDCYYERGVSVCDVLIENSILKPKKCAKDFIVLILRTYLIEVKSIQEFMAIIPEPRFYGTLFFGLLWCGLFYLIMNL